VRADAADAVAEVVAGRQHLIAAGDLDGVVFLRPGTGPRVAHRADVLRLMVHPSAQGRGLGRRLLDAAVDHARGLGLEQLLLSARGGTTLPEFYTRLGWTPVGVFPGALRLGPGDVRDEHWFQLRLPPGPG
jgi:GNAT superfamily N-acetyltransferase